MKEGWLYRKLEDVCDINYGTRVVQKNDKGSKYYVYGGGGATFMVDTYNREDCFVVSRFAMSPKCTRFVKGKFFLNDSGLSVSPKVDVLYQAYLDKVLLANNDAIYNMGKGMAQRNLDMPSFRNLTIPIPSLEEQKRIVAELDLLTGIIEKQKQQLKELDNLAQSIFYDMFGNPVDNEKEFPLLTVDDVVSFQGGSQPDKSHFEFEPTKDNIRLLQIRDYRTDKYPTYIPISLARRFCTKDDIMIGRYGPPIFQIFKGLEGSYNVALMKAVPKKGNREFIRAFLKQKCLLHFLESHSKRTAGQDGIQMDKLKAYPFPFPPIELQNQFEERMRIIEQQQEILNRSIAESQKLFDYTMDKYFG